MDAEDYEEEIGRLENENCDLRADNKVQAQRIAELAAKLERKEETHKGVLKEWLRQHDRFMAAGNKRIETLEDELKGIASFREKAWEYDDDVGNERRTFLDAEEWGRVEGFAQAALDKEE